VLRDDAGRARTETRVMDVRLHRTRGSWRLDRIESVGGRRVARPPDLPRAARRVLSNRRIDLFDSARWDIFRGYVDAGLLNALDAAARRHRLAVLTLRSGHPRNVWGTSRVSAHSKGFAADVYSIDGRLVVRQRRSGSRAHRLAKMLLDRGARQLGGPWVLGDGPPRSFTDEVHQDHLHLQQDAVR